MVRFGGGGEFAAAMQDIAQWGEVTLIVHTDDAIFEFTGAIPAGEIGRGYFNLMQPKGLHGHLRHERCGGIAFVERPFMGKSSAFVAFLNVDGGIMFKVFVGRDETRALRATSLQRFHALADRIAAAGAPKPIRIFRRETTMRETVARRYDSRQLEGGGRWPRASLPGAALAATDDALLPRNLSPWSMFVNADIVVKAVMVGLAFASLVTWTVWLAKTIELRRKTRDRKTAARPARERHHAGRPSNSRAAAAAMRWRRSSSPRRARPASPAAISTTASRNASRCGWSGSRPRCRGRSRAAPACSPPSAPPRRSSACSARCGAS